MKFVDALTEMKKGKKMKLPTWGGYWKWDEKNQTIMMHCRKKDADTGKDVLDIRETQKVEYTVSNILSDEWEEATSENCTLLGGVPTFNFKTAVRCMKKGFHVKRKGGTEYYLYCNSTGMLFMKNRFGTVPVSEETAKNFYEPYNDWTFADEENDKTHRKPVIKAFISQPMRGLTDEEILTERERAKETLNGLFKGELVEIIDTFFDDVPDKEVKKAGTWYLGKSLMKMAEADIVYFVKGWENARGCLVENTVASAYGITVLRERDE